MGYYNVNDDWTTFRHTMKEIIELLKKKFLIREHSIPEFEEYETGSEAKQLEVPR